MSLQIRDLHVSYGTRPVLLGVDLDVPDGELTAVLGPNGSGKSTLAKVVARIARPASGSVTVDGRDLHSLPRREHASVVAYVPQVSATPFDLTVRDMVMLGRTPHIGMRPRAQDHEIVDRELGRLRLGELATRPMAELSGGQAQRVLVARALAQEPRVLILDEPTSALDLRYQVETLEVVREVAIDRSVAVLVVIHDLNHAAWFCGHSALLHEGRVLRSGHPTETFDAATLSQVYGLEIDVTHPAPGMVEVRPRSMSASAARRTVAPVLEPASTSV
ncbi:ABC transporter related protein [Xylanimonas cellulosilytica DSM 15894]|uniref:ABC transporter related protein n=1 Tax=Xylanimonas cellulosilytica (strain DSM 15894 / JCM 12276 / CECT 5975 / KCTC 9989 / LMG 20990 / NBRC 107835 / XIL07) TaxID=446471 RepID=D1BVK6_XYLCX|nr:ABC transporter ATP-binding protein [Xylanimonas cellulosilytica]ACZ31325.1 ABC transporter related protein [Xylanimonas cellulosilytica DSM 15894]